jgi:hypothetical protein
MPFFGIHAHSQPESRLVEKSLISMSPALVHPESQPASRFIPGKKYGTVSVIAAHIGYRLNVFAAKIFGMQAHRQPESKHTETVLIITGPVLALAIVAYHVSTFATCCELIYLGSPQD